jgi:hypothetical protein
MNRTLFLALLALLCVGAVVSVSCSGKSSSGSSSQPADDDQAPADDDQSPADDDSGSLPPGVSAFLSQQDIDTLEKDGMKIYPGSNPPNITGYYIANSLVVVYDTPDNDVGAHKDECKFHFYNQTAAGGITEDFTDTTPGSNDSGTGLGAFISGSGQCFSVFVDLKGTDFGCNYESPEIYSGCLTAQGIQGFMWGFMLTSETGQNCGVLMPVGAVRIVDEQSGLAPDGDDDSAD